METNPYAEEQERPAPSGMGELLKKKLPSTPVVKKPVKIHSEEHELADQISKYFNEPKRFGMWLGIINKHGVQKVYTAWAEVKQSTARHPVMLLMHKLKAKKKDE